MTPSISDLISEAIAAEREACAALMDAKNREHEKIAHEFVGKDTDMACVHRSMSLTYGYAASDIRARGEREGGGDVRA